MALTAVESPCLTFRTAGPLDPSRFLKESMICTSQVVCRPHSFFLRSVDLRKSPAPSAQGQAPVFKTNARAVEST